MRYKNFFNEDAIRRARLLLALVTELVKFIRDGGWW
jgi:hypothetical protein